MPSARLLLLMIVLPLAVVAAIPESEELLPPGAARLAALSASARREGWAGQVAGLRNAALAAYRRDKLSSAEAWYHVYRWSQLFAQSEPEFVRGWIAAVQAARVGHANMAREYHPGAQPLAASLSPTLQAWVLGNAAFSAEFFGLLTPVDYLPRAFAILDELHARDPARFKSHTSLALAIALVHDVPPPPHWPHVQVPPAVLPRKLPPPAEAFAWWLRQEQLGRTHHRLARLGADELKFAIDAAAPFAELEWAQGAVKLPLNQIASAYSMVRYRQDRVTGNQPVWTGSSYALPAILATGGICADQAYFAAQVGKARGVPTLLFNGAGNDGRHAWFGFLDGNRRWQLDAGRYAEQKFVTGYAYDPQTWGLLSDHDLQFLAERFRELPSYRQSRVHALFAADLLAAGDTAGAAAAARKAVAFERRNQAGWEILIESAERQGRDPKPVESILREAALAFRPHADLHAHFSNRLAASLRARGQASEAEEVIRQIALKYRSTRGDLSVQQAREIVFRATATQPIRKQIDVYNRVMDTYGRGAGIAFFDGVVVPFAEHLSREQQPGEAAKAVERARRTLRVEPNSQLEAELARLGDRVRRAGGQAITR